MATVSPGFKAVALPCSGTAHPPLSRWVTVTVANARRQVPGADDAFGASLAAGDLNRDGKAELAWARPAGRARTGACSLSAGHLRRHARGGQDTKSPFAE